MGILRKRPPGVEITITVEVKAKTQKIQLYRRRYWCSGIARISDVLFAAARGPWTELEERSITARLR